MLVLRELHWLPVRQRIRYKLVMTVYKCLQIGADVLGRRLSGNLCHGRQVTPMVHWHRDTVSTKNKDHVGDQEFCGRRSIYLEQFTGRPSNCNCLSIYVRSTFEGPPVRLIDSASEDHI